MKVDIPPTKEKKARIGALEEQVWALSQMADDKLTNLKEEVAALEEHIRELSTMADAKLRTAEEEARMVALEE